MRRTHCVVSLLLSLTSTHALAQNPPPVELLVRAPDGSPLADHDLRLTDADSGTNNSHPRITRTDAQGIARFDWPTGVTQINVTADGVGFGQTGTLLVDPAKTTVATLPPLAPFAHLDGTLALPFRLAGVTIEAHNYFAQYHIQATPDANGRFQFDVPPGTWTLWAALGMLRIATGPAQLEIHSGETQTALIDTLFPPPPAADPRRMVYPMSNRPGPDAPWVQGTLADPSGRPIADATIYVVATYFSGTRTVEEVRNGVSDAQGHYLIAGPSNQSMFSATLVAAAPGYAPGWGFFTIDNPTAPYELGAEPATRPAPPPQKIDLALSNHPGSLDVRILLDGKPVAGAVVVAELEGAQLRTQWAASSGPDADAPRELANPSATTTADGIAHFAHLLPGNYRLTAAEHATARPLRNMNALATPRTPLAQAWGIAVRPDHLTTTRLALIPPPAPVNVRLLDHEGQRLTGRLAFNLSSFGSSGSASSTKVGDGLRVLEVNEPGWCRWSFQFRDLAMESIPLHEPCFQVDGLAAVSAWLPEFPPPTFQALWHEPGSIRVRVTDAGRPLRGVVEVQSSGSEQFADLAGSLDPQGEVLFQSVTTWKHTISAVVNGFANPLRPGHAPHVKILPADADLLGRRMILNPDVTPTFNTTRTIDLRPEPVSFVRGLIKPAPGETLSDVYLYVYSAEDARGARAQMNPDTGEFVAGPFPAGIAHLVINQGQHSVVHTIARELAVDPSRIARLDVQLPPAGDKSLLGVAGLTAFSRDASPLQGKVFLPDGKSPAAAAQLLYFPEDAFQPHFAAMTDGNGVMHARPLPVSGNADDRQHGTHHPPLVLAYLPGNHGVATITALNRDLSITLPPSRTVTGHITIAGQPLGTKPARLRILAAHQSDSLLHQYLDVETSADADGNFELAGLTPGIYHIQAALDDVWFSPTLSLTAGDAPLAPITLDIPAPSAPLILQITNANGSARAGATLHISRPDGPLTSRYSPTDWPADGNGTLHIPTLESGPHTLTLEGATLSQNVQLSADKPQEIQLHAPPP